MDHALTGSDDEGERGHPRYGSGFWDVVTSPFAPSPTFFDPYAQTGALLGNHSQFDLAIEVLTKKEFEDLLPFMMRDGPFKDKNNDELENLLEVLNSIVKDRRWTAPNADPSTRGNVWEFPDPVTSLSLQDIYDTKCKDAKFLNSKEKRAALLQAAWEYKKHSFQQMLERDSWTQEEKKWVVESYLEPYFKNLFHWTGIESQLSAKDLTELENTLDNFTQSKESKTQTLQYLQHLFTSVAPSSPPSLILPSPSPSPLPVKSANAKLPNLLKETKEALVNFESDSQQTNLHAVLEQFTNFINAYRNVELTAINDSSFAQQQANFRYLNEQDFDEITQKYHDWIKLYPGVLEFLSQSANDIMQNQMACLELLKEAELSRPETKAEKAVRLEVARLAWKDRKGMVALMSSFQRRVTQNFAAASHAPHKEVILAASKELQTQLLNLSKAYESLTSTQPLIPWIEPSAAKIAYDSLRKKLPNETITTIGIDSLARVMRTMPVYENTFYNNGTAAMTMAHEFSTTLQFVSSFKPLTVLEAQLRPIADAMQQNGWLGTPNVKYYKWLLSLFTSKVKEDEDDEDEAPLTSTEPNPSPKQQVRDEHAANLIATISQGILNDSQIDEWDKCTRSFHQNAPYASRHKELKGNMYSNLGMCIVHHHENVEFQKAFENISKSFSMSTPLTHLMLMFKLSETRREHFGVYTRCPFWYWPKVEELFNFTLNPHVDEDEEGQDASDARNAVDFIQFFANSCYANTNKVSICQIVLDLQQAKSKGAIADFANVMSTVLTKTQEAALENVKTWNTLEIIDKLYGQIASETADKVTVVVWAMHLASLPSPMQEQFIRLFQYDLDDLDAFVDRLRKANAKYLENAFQKNALTNALKRKNSSLNDMALKDQAEWFAQSCESLARQEFLIQMTLTRLRGVCLYILNAHGPLIAMAFVMLLALHKQRHKLDLRLHNLRERFKKIQNSGGAKDSPEDVSVAQLRTWLEQTTEALLQAQEYESRLLLVFKEQKHESSPFISSPSISLYAQELGREDFVYAYLTCEFANAAKRFVFDCIYDDSDKAIFGFITIGVFAISITDTKVLFDLKTSGAQELMQKAFAEAEKACKKTKNTFPDYKDKIDLGFTLQSEVARTLNEVTLKSDQTIALCQTTMTSVSKLMRGALGSDDKAAYVVSQLSGLQQEQLYLIYMIWCIQSFTKDSQLNYFKPDIYNVQDVTESVHAFRSTMRVCNKKTSIFDVALLRVAFYLNYIVPPKEENSKPVDVALKERLHAAANSRTL